MGSFDLDAATAARREAVQEPTEFTWKGEQFSVPNPVLWPLAVQKLLAEGSVVDAMRGIMGDEQYGRFEALGPSLLEVTAVLEAVGKDTGSGDTLGE